MTALHGPHSCSHMRRLSAHLKLFTKSRARVFAATCHIGSFRPATTSVVPPVRHTSGFRATTANSSLPKMSEDLPVAKRARLDPVVAAAVTPAAEAPAACPTAAPTCNGVVTTADSSPTTPLGSRRRIRRSRSPTTQQQHVRHASTEAFTPAGAPAEQQTAAAEADIMANGAKPAAVATLRSRAVEELDALESSTQEAAAATATAESSQPSSEAAQDVVPQQQVRHATAGTVTPAAALKQQTRAAAAANITANGAEPEAATLQCKDQNGLETSTQAAAEATAAEAAAAGGPSPTSSEAAEEVVPQQQQQQQQPQQQKQPKQQQQKQSKKNKKQSSPVFQLTMGIHQCIKMDMPHEAFHLYQKIKTVEPTHKMDTGIVSALLNLIVGKWRWELHQRHQHLVRQYTSSGKDTADLDAAYEACVAAALQEKQQQQQQNDGHEIHTRIVGVEPPGTPEDMICHVEKQIEFQDETKLQKDMVAALLSDMDPDHKLSMQQLTESAVAVALEDLKSNGQIWDEQIYLQLARISGITGDIDKAHEYAMQLVSAWQSSNKSNKLLPRLRDFQPALVGYALTGQADKATELIDIMTKTCELDLTEPEFGLWLEAIARGGTYNQLTTALTAVAGELNELRSNTVDMVARFFKSNPAAAEPLAALDKQQWQQQWVLPDSEGFVTEADVKLQLADLSSEDWEAFGNQVKSLAVQQEKRQGKFQEFVTWLRRNGPYDIMIDGANVALWGENYEGGGFKPEKIRVMHETVTGENPDAKILLVLHGGRLNDIKQNHPDMAEWLQQLYNKKLFYTAPGGSNDDWYWMFATVMAREKGVLVSNDLLRDHVWNLLRPKHMLKWNRRHIIRFSFNFEKTEVYLKYPLPYTPCVQYDDDKGVWMLPCADKDGQWLCVRPV